MGAGHQCFIWDIICLRLIGVDNFIGHCISDADFSQGLIRVRDKITFSNYEAKAKVRDCSHNLAFYH